MPDSSWLEFLEKISVNNSALSDAEDNTFEPLNRRDSRFSFVENTIGIAKSPESQVSGKGWTLLLAYISLAALRTLLQWLPVCLNFTIESKDLFCWYKWKMWFV